MDEVKVKVLAGALYGLMREDHWFKHGTHRAQVKTENTAWDHCMNQARHILNGIRDGRIHDNMTQIPSILKDIIKTIN